MAVGIAPQGDHSGAGGTVSSEAEAGAAERAVPLARPQCPEQEPQAGTDCTPEGIVCSYGSSVSSLCRATYTCSGYSWMVASEGPCVEPPEGYCPEVPPTNRERCVASGPDDPAMWTDFRSGTTCEYDGGVGCECHCCFPELGEQVEELLAWVCQYPPEDLNCPLVAPNLGEGCATEGTECTYGDPCRSGHKVACRDGVWEYGSYLCG